MIQLGGLLVRKLFIGVIIFIFASVVAGCSSPKDNIYQTLEETAAKEKEFNNQQEPIAELETQENSLFDEIMTLGMKEFEETTKLADEALKNLDKREELMKKEKEALDAAKKEFTKFSGEIEKIKDEKLKAQATELQALMNKRYESHHQLFEAYSNGLNEDRKIYEMIKDEDLMLEDLELQIETTNAIYESVFEANTQFNQLTEEFNDAKIKFYEEFGINIEKSK
jgi:hypothetical protein